MADQVVSEIRRSRFTAYLLLLLSVAPACAGENWPAWRGPEGTGHSDEKGLPLTWGGKSQENVFWKSRLFPSDKVRRDQNQSSPIVWGERVFVTVSYWPESAGEKDFPEHHVICYQAKDGKKLWDTAIAPGPWKLTDLRGGYTCPTPATDGSRVYVIFGSSVVAAVDFQGRIAWRKEITPYAFDVAWGASPVLYDGAVIVVCDQTQGKSSIYSFDGKTGDVRWERKRPQAGWAHSTPLLTKVAGKVQLVTATHNGPQGIDPANGEILWSYHTNDQVGDTVTPTYRDGLLYLDSGRGSAGFAFTIAGSEDISRTPPKWKVARVPEAFSSPLLVGDYIYRLHSPGSLSCWKWSTGEEVYKERLDGVEQAVSPFASADGRIYCASARTSYVLAAGPNPRILARNDMDDPSRASPAVAAGRIFLKGSRYLYCISSD